MLLSAHLGFIGYHELDVPHTLSTQEFTFINIRETVFVVWTFKCKNDPGRLKRDLA